MMMQKIKIGAVTIGQSPRTDITEDAGRFFGDRVELLEFGALDRYTLEEAKQLQPIPGDYVLTSRLRDGTEVHFSRGQVMEEMQRGIHLLEERGVKLILVFCTGALHGLHSNVPMLEPNQLLRAMAPLLTQKPRILTLTPSETQGQQCERRWKRSRTLNLRPSRPARIRTARSRRIWPAVSTPLRTQIWSSWTASASPPRCATDCKHGSIKTSCCQGHSCSV